MGVNSLFIYTFVNYRVLSLNVSIKKMPFHLNEQKTNKHSN